MGSKGIVQCRDLQPRRTRPVATVGFSLAFSCALLLLAGMANADPRLPTINTNLIFDVTNTIFAGGARGDGVSNSTAAIQAAINMASTSIVASATGGTVRVRAAGTLTNYVSGPIAMKNNVNLLIDAGTKLQMFPMSIWTNISTASTPFISGSGLHDVEISGSGTLDGNAGFSSGSTSNWWGKSGANNPETTRPQFLNINSTANLLVQGVTLQNPPVSHFVFKNNDTNVTIQGVVINTVTNSPNTDSEFTCNNMLIRNCIITCGDDNLVTSGSNITISNCTFNAGHGLSIGSYTTSGMINLLVSNCAWNGTEYGIHMKSARGRGGLVQNLTYRDLTMTNVNFVIAIYSYYDWIGSPSHSINVTPFQASTDSVQTVTSTTPIWQNITISNVTASTLGGNIAGIIWGLPEMAVSNITISGVNISDPTKTFCVYNARRIQFLDSNLTAPNTTTNTLTLFNAEITVTNHAANTNLVTLGGLAVSPTNNVLALFNMQVAITDTNMLGAGSMTLGGTALSFTQGAVTFSNNLSVASASSLGFTSGTNALYGALGGSGPLTFNLPGSSLLTLKGNSSGYSGNMTVSNGTLLVNNTSGSGTGNGLVTVVSGATLGGNGVIGGPVTVNGTLAPGNSPGTLTISNNLVVSGGAALRFDLGTSSDLVAVSSNLTLGGTLNVANAGGFTNITYRLFNYGGTLTYNGLAVGTKPNSNFTYTVSTDTPGQVNLVVGSAAPTLDAFAAWQLQYFGCTNCPQADGAADPYGKGISNTNQFLLGLNPTNSASVFRILWAVQQTTDVVIAWAAGGGRTNAVQTSAGDANGGYTTNFDDFSGLIILSGSGDVTTNYTDSGGATNVPGRYYRVRLVP